MTILVIGSSSHHSIGYDIAKCCQKVGLKTVITSRRAKFLERLSSEGFDARYLDYPTHCDELSSLTTIEGVVFCIAKTDVEELRNGVLNVSEDNFERTMATNCYALIDLTRRVRPLLSECASVVALTFFGSTTVIPGYGLLGIAKAALEQTIRTLAWELGSQRIRVNGISAGANAPLHHALSRALDPHRRVLRKIHVSAGGIDRSEIANAVLWLLSRESGGVTGEVVQVNGGARNVLVS